MIGSRKVIRDQDQYGQRKGSRSGITHSKIPTDRIFLQPARLLVGDKDQGSRVEYGGSRIKGVLISCWMIPCSDDLSKRQGRAPPYMGRRPC